MNLKQLETFTLVANVGSLSKAAKALDIAQSLVSRHLAQLESEWGDRLFERTGRGVVLTDFGRRLQPEVGLLLNQADRLRMAARETAGVLSGTVHVGVLPSMSRQLLPMLIDDLSATAPAIRLHVTEGFSGSLDEQLGSGRLDMIVVNRYGAAAPRGEDALGVVDTFLVGRPDHPALQNRTFQFRKLAGLPLVLPSTPNGLRSTLDHIAREQHISLNVIMEVDTNTAMKDVAASGHALTVLPMLAVRDECREGRLAAVRISKPFVKRTIALSFTKQRPLSKAARLVGSRLRSFTTKLLAV
jgi:LysR family nitrogen assimilation transcriptional regulator